jgi:hypothetical protein
MRDREVPLETAPRDPMGAQPVPSQLAAAGGSPRLGTRLPPAIRSLLKLFPPAAGLAVGKALLDYLPQPLSQNVARYLVAGRFRQPRVVETLWRLQMPTGGWSARTQSTVGRPEVTAWVLSALLQAGRDEERVSTAVQRSSSCSTRWRIRLAGNARQWSQPRCRCATSRFRHVGSAILTCTLRSCMPAETVYYMSARAAPDHGHQ